MKQTSPKAAADTAQFTKMHGLGNDFVVMDGRLCAPDLSPARIRRIADRRTGVGCDQVLLVMPASRPRFAFSYRVFNADGAEVEQCGNGLRCVARWLHDRGEIPDHAVLEGAAGPMAVWLGADGVVTVDMGQPKFDPAEIPFAAAGQALDYERLVAGQQLRFAALSMGNPHAVIRVTDLAGAAVAELGPAVQAEAGFPAGVNVGFLSVLARDRLALRVFERGSGETMACGSGACAAAVAARRWGLTDESVSVELPGGALRIQWSGDNDRVMMSGPAQYAFTGRLALA